jgi:Zn-dependent peptidase ImmA (M78 family)
MVKFELKSVGCDERGLYYEESERIIIYLSNHEDLEDIYKTITHELIHHCIHKADMTMDEDQEERLIYCFQWAEEYI